jgi:hypothetical protein
MPHCIASPRQLRISQTNSLAARRQQQPHQQHTVHCLALHSMHSSQAWPVPPFVYCCCRQGDPGESHLVLAMDDPGMPAFTMWQDILCEWALCRAALHRCWAPACWAPAISGFASVRSHTFGLKPTPVPISLPLIVMGGAVSTEGLSMDRVHLLPPGHRLLLTKVRREPARALPRPAKLGVLP